MFYDTILLQFQHKGNFGKAWAAGTKGVQCIPKAQINDINIAKLCTHLLNYIITESTSPKKRFSLRLSSILMHGTIRIYRQQVLLLEADVLSLIQTVRIPPGSRTIYRGRKQATGRRATAEEIEANEGPQTPIAQVKRKRRPRTEVFPTPVSQLPEDASESAFNEPDFPVLPDIQDILNVNMAQANDITLIEELPGRVYLADPADFGGPGDGAVVPTDQLMREWDMDLQPASQAPTISDSSDPLSVAPPVIVVQAQIHREPEPPARPAAEVPPEGPAAEEPVEEPTRRTKRPRVQRRPASGEADIENIQPVEEIAQAPEEPAITVLPPAAPPTPQRRSVLRELVDNVDRERRESQSSKGSSEKSDNFSRLFLKPRGTRRRFVRINRCSVNEDVFLDTSCPTLSIAVKNSTNPELTEMFMTDLVLRRELSPIQEDPTPAEPTEAPPASVSSDKGPSKDLSKRSTLERTAGRALSSSSREGSMPRTGLRITDLPGPSTSHGRQMVVEAIVHRESSVPLELPEVAQELPPTTPGEPAIRPLRPLSLAVDEEMPQIPVNIEEEIQELPTTSREPTIRPIRPLSPVIGVVQEEMPQISGNIEEEIIVAAAAQQELPARRPRRISDTSGGNRRAEKERQQKIIDIILKWNFDEKPLTIKDMIVQRPFSRIEISRVFYDLLCLAKSQLVTLVNEENSLQLKRIEKGPKLIGYRS